MKKSQGFIFALTKAVLTIGLVWSFAVTQAFADGEVSPWVQMVNQARVGEIMARDGLKKNPGSRELKRDLGDALHHLGHVAEEQGDFERAMQLHQESLQLFKESGLPARGSWNDGVDHAMEHVFMDLFDMGDRALRAHDEQTGNAYMDRAYDWSEQNDLVNKVGRSDRFLPRYYAMAKLRGAQTKELSFAAARTTGAICQNLLFNPGMIKMMHDFFSKKKAG